MTNFKRNILLISSLKKVLIIFFLIFNSGFVYTQLNYKYVLNDIKDHIIIQSLLTENRTNELNDFFINNGYSKLIENNNLKWIKLEQFNSFSKGESDIFGVFVIEDDVDRKGFSNFKVNIFYQINDGSEIRKLNKSESLMLKNVIYEKLDPGFAYGIFKKFYETENQDVKDHIIVIDDRTVKSFNEKSQSYDTYKCSNFMFMSTAINKGFSFFGPEAKYSWLEFGFYPMELESGELLVHFYSIASLNDEDLKNRNFNIKKFQSSKGLNDIIWQKERF
jgi:hypothetical protein